MFDEWYYRADRPHAEIARLKEIADGWERTANSLKVDIDALHASRHEELIAVANSVRKYFAFVSDKIMLEIVAEIEEQRK